MTFLAHDFNVILGTLEADTITLRQLNITPPYADIRHLLCGKRSTATSVHHRESGLNLTFRFAQINKEVSIWLKIIDHFLILGKHMTDITYDKVCLVYALIWEDIDINVGVVILSRLKKGYYHQGHKYGFGGLLTRFLRYHNVEEEEEAMDYRPVIDTCPIDITRTRGLDVAYGIVLTFLESHARSSCHTLLRIGPDFLELIDDDVPTNEEWQMRDSDINS